MIYAIALWSALLFVISGLLFAIYLEIYYRINGSFLYLFSARWSVLLPLLFFTTSIVSAVISIFCSVLYLTNTL